MKLFFDPLLVKVLKEKPEAWLPDNKNHRVKLLELSLILDPHQALWVFSPITTGAGLIEFSIEHHLNLLPHPIQKRIIEDYI